MAPSIAVPRAEASFGPYAASGACLSAPVERARACHKGCARAGSPQAAYAEAAFGVGPKDATRAQVARQGASIAATPSRGAAAKADPSIAGGSPTSGATSVSCRRARTPPTTSALARPSRASRANAANTASTLAAAGLVRPTWSRDAALRALPAA